MLKYLLLSFIVLSVSCSSPINYLPSDKVDIVDWKGHYVYTEKDEGLCILLPPSYSSFNLTNALFEAAKSSYHDYSPAIIISRTFYDKNLDEDYLNYLIINTLPDFTISKLKEIKDSSLFIGKCSGETEGFHLKGYYACLQHPKTKNLFHITILADDNESGDGYNKSSNEMLRIINAFTFDCDEDTFIKKGH